MTETNPLDSHLPPQANAPALPKLPPIPVVEDGEISEQLAAIKGTNIDNKHLASCLLSAFGEAEGLAKKTAILYRKSKPGSLAQNAILRTVYDVIRSAAPKEGATDNIDQKDLKELDQLFQALLQKVNEQ